MEVHKGRKISRFGGDEWNRFIAHVHLTEGVLISFSFRRETPRLVVIYINSEDEDDEDPLDEALYAQRIRLSEDDSGNLWYILPPRDDYVGMPFVTRLTGTNVNRHVMRLSESCGIKPNEVGIAGLRLTARGSITNCAHAVDTDSRTVFSATGWNNFLAGKLQVGQVILVTIRNTRHHDLTMIIVIDLI
ncbi:uncharacterized protein [Triticum aestivum]|uniref:uncharacterized protein n=1 Tax=Triticum aestivum TaxID=4565 RepID=UPI001D02E854|nr:uncharacterized protein LOC123076158 [Triticum aestivum]